MDDLNLDTPDEGGQSWEDSIESTLDTLDTDLEEPIGRPRDEQGRFAKKEETEPETPTETPSEPSETPVETPEPVAPVWRPSSWKKEELEGFDGLPAHSRAAIERREKEITRSLEESAQARKYGESLNQIAAPYMPLLQSIGATPQAAFQEALNLFSQLRNGSPAQRAAVVNSIAQQYGVQLGGNTQDQPNVDPVLSATQQEIAVLRNQMARIEQQRQWQEQQQYVSQISDFAKDKPDFEVLKPLIAQKLEAGLANDLPTAYNLAKESVSSLYADQAKAQEEARKAEAAKKAAEAKKAAAVNVKPKGAPSTQVPKPKSWQDAVSVNLDDILART